MLRSLLTILFLIPTLVFCQEQPPIMRYSSEDYNAGNQNWMISQSNDDHIFVANNEGLLEFDGAEWKLYESPNETIMRSVQSVNNRVYTGCYMEFGYWERDDKNILHYVSLSDKVKDKVLEDEQFWKIIPYEQWVLFQSLDRIYIYDTTNETFEIISPENGIVYAFLVNDNILFQSPNKGIFELKNGTSSFLVNGDVLANTRIIDILSKDDGYMIVTDSKGLYFYSGGILNKMNIPANDLLSKLNVYSSALLKNKSLALGTISNGMIIISEDGQIEHSIEQTSGLGNNTILSMFQDKRNNLWLGLDNGIDCLNMQSPVTTFYDGQGILGTIYTAVFFKKNLYVGTNQGLFYKSEKEDKFKLVPGTRGQVWSLLKFDNQLFCGHNSGTFIIENNTPRLISPNDGTWKISEVPGKQDILIQGDYYGLAVLKKNSDGDWYFSNRIKNFDYSSKHFELENESQIFISHEYKGIFKVNLDKDFQEATQVEHLENPMKGKNSSLAKFNNSIYYASKNGVYQMKPGQSVFKKDSIFNSVFEEKDFFSGKLVSDRTGKLWMFTRSDLSYISRGKLSSNLKFNNIPIPLSLRKMVEGYENIAHIRDNIFLVGFTNGYFTVDLDKFQYNQYIVRINKVTQLDKTLNTQHLSRGGQLNLEYAENNISFTYGVPEYQRFLVPEYQYLLEGYVNIWSSWSKENQVDYENLPYGDYTFKVRSKIGSKITEEMATYKFRVMRPWYLSNLMIMLYTIAFLVMAFVIHKAYKNYYKKQQARLLAENQRQMEMKQMETKQELMKLKNERLKLDVDSKNRELAVSTMSLINKNEILIKIKEELTKEGNIEKNIKSVINTIKQNTREEDNWNYFKDAFNNADSNFLKKVKALHSNLTPNDLRLCAYLRLNLSSKEIAPLLNISVRSVEIKRYRLRKKIALEHEKSLVEYILSI